MSLCTLIDNALFKLAKEIHAHIEKGSCSITRSATLEVLDYEIADLESALEQLQSKTAALQRQIETRAANVRKQCNVLVSPIYRLPEEILAAILFSVIEMSEIRERDDWRDKARCNIMGVSWHWFNIVISTPLLSSFLFNRHHINKTERLIELSRNASLDITCFDHYSTSKLNRFMELVLPHLHRWRSFHWDTLPLDDSSWHPPQVSAPLLEKFTVVSRTNNAKEITNLFNGHAPRLQVLKIQPFQLSWDTPILSGLTELSIIDGYGEDGQWVNRYYDLFKSMPLLEQIYIRLNKDLRGTEATEPLIVGTQTGPIVLPKLKSIRLDDLPARISATILSSLVTSPIQYPHVRVNFSHAEPWLAEVLSLSQTDGFLPSVSRWLIHLRVEYLISGGPLRLWGHFPDSRIFDWSSQAHWMLNFEHSPLPPAPTLTSFTASLITPNLKELSFYGNITSGELGFDLSQVLPLLINLEALSLAYNVNVHRILNSLQTLHGNGNVSKGSGDLWPCPKLRRLSFSRVDFEAERLRDLISFRYGDGASGRGGEKAVLEWLEVHKCNPRIDDGWGAIMRAVGTIVEGQNGVFSLKPSSILA